MAPKKRRSSTSKSSSRKSQSSTSQRTIDHPDDVFPLSLTSATQELFDVRADEDLTDQSPYKLLKKDSIIQDIKTRAAVSDFSPVKQSILDYPEEEILLVFDSSLTYGQSFFLVLTPEAQNRILKPPESETPEVFENEVNKTAEPKKWISLGSEKEIDEESVKETREKLKFKFLKPRRTFGLPVKFSDRSARDGFAEFVSYVDSRFSIKLMLRDCGMQAVPTLQNRSSQTRCMVQRYACTQYSPRELSKEQIESILQSESLKNFLETVIPRMEYALQEEEIANVFTDDWKDLGTGFEPTGRPENLRNHQVFTERKLHKDTEISSMSWHPTISGVIAVALMEKKVEQSDKSSLFTPRPAFIVFYSLSDPSNSQLLLESPQNVLAFEFCPSNPNIIVGGCLNGQVVLWDISGHYTHLQGAQSGSKKSSGIADSFNLFSNKGNETPVQRSCAVSALESSHTAPITDVHWLPPTFEVDGSLYVDRSNSQLTSVEKLRQRKVLLGIKENGSSGETLTFHSFRSRVQVFILNFLSHKVTSMSVPVENKLNLSVQVVTCSHDCTIMLWDVRLLKPTGQTLSGRKQDVAQKTPMMTCSFPDTYKHLNKTWEPLLKIDTTGQFIPIKFSLEPYTTNNNNTEKDSKNWCTENIPDYSQLTVPSDTTLKAPEDVNTKFFIGTMDGELVYTGWNLEKDAAERLHMKPLMCVSAHYLPVNTVQRSPFFKDIILTTGCWNFAIWKEGVMEGPLVLSVHSEQESTVGCWSLSRPAVFFIGKEDGRIEVWNLLKNTSEPSQIYANIINTKITCMKPWTVSSKQHLLAVTDDHGVLHVFELPKTLYIPTRQESSTMKTYIEHQTDVLRARLKSEERWAKEKKEVKEVQKTMEPVKPVMSLMDIQEAEIKEYLSDQMVEESMGLWPA